MKYYLGNEGDEIFAVYSKDGCCYPVFVEKYGEKAIAYDPEMRAIEDAQTIEALDKYMQPYSAGKRKVYMAGPLFNEGDRYTNQINSDALRALGYTTFLPQEVVITKDSSNLVKAACFYMDLKAIKECDVLLANCNGIEIDSGTAAEIGLAYGLQKRMILYKSDVRNYYNETFRLNNFVGGLADNQVCSTITEVIAIIETL
ncbi:MAG: nucleoside 2-deoxyribosyltransferase [Clostridiales bacterium]|nr:nucleoside 2-deoxyribosyltransferase [Clostridiales bacterium]